MKYLSTLNLNSPVTTTGGGAFRTLPDRFADVINLRDQVAGTGSGSASIDTAAMTAALTKASQKPGSTIFIPAGTYVFAVPASSTLFSIPPSTKILGAGRDEVLLTWNDDPGCTLFGSTGTSTVRSSNVILASFSIQGSAASKASTNSFAFNLSYIDALEFNSVGTTYSRNTAICAFYCSDVHVHGCSVKYSMGDGVALQGCTNILVSDNRIRHIDGDSISINSDTLDIGKVRRNITVQGNRIFDAQGIRIMSARHLALSGNQMDAIRSYAVNVSTSAPTGSGNLLGAASGIAISISANTITNLISRANIDSQTQGCPAIILSGASARAGSYAGIPGEPNNTAGSIIDPYREVFANANIATTPTSGLYAVSITGNTVARTLPACNNSDSRFTKWSDFGLGPIFTKAGNKDPSLSESDLRDAGILISGGIVRDVLIGDNIFRGLDCGISFANGVRYDNIVFRSNNVIDCYSNGVFVNTGGLLRAYIDTNIFDLDPFLKHSNRGLNGTWQTSQGPTGINIVSGSGLYVRSNILRNMTLDCSTNSSLQSSGVYFDKNVVEADPAILDAFSTSNKGVGLVHSNFGTLLSRADSDPTSATFGSILAMPTMPTASLVGRASAGSGSAETIALGLGLVLSGSTLSVSLPTPVYANQIQATGAVSSIQITQQAGYRSFPTVLIGAPPAGGSQAVAVVTQMAIFAYGGLTVVGFGYSQNDVLTLVGGTGTSATIKVTGIDGNGGISSFVGILVGSYTALPSGTISLTGGTGSGAKLAGMLFTPTFVAVTVSGGGYSSPPPVIFSSYAGTTAAANTVLSNNFSLTGGNGQISMTSAGTAIGLYGAIGSPVIHSGSMVEQSRVRISATGAALVIPNNTSWFSLIQTGTLASLGLTLPSPSGDGQLLRISTIGAISALNLTPLSNSTVAWTNGNALAANSSVLFGWDAGLAMWVRL